MSGSEHAALAAIWAAYAGDPAAMAGLQTTGTGDLPSVFPVTDLAAASVGAAGLAVAGLIAARHGTAPAVVADRRLASFWFGTAIRPQGWATSEFEPLTGDYQAADGWIRLHVNAPHHRAAMLAVVDAPPDRAAVAEAVSPLGCRRAGGRRGRQWRRRGCHARPSRLGRPSRRAAAVAAKPILHRHPRQRRPAAKLA